MRKIEVFNEQVMLITGTRKGIGKYLAEYYCEKEFQVLGCSRDPASIEHSNYQHFCLDISDEREVKKMFSSVRKTYNRLDVLINNAAVNPLISLALMIPVEIAMQTFQVNFFGTFITSREAVKLMKKRSIGRIVNFGSMAVKHEVPGESIYTASKAAILAYSKIFAKEIFPLGITCNVVSPSAIETDLTAVIDKKALKEVLKRNAIPCLGEMAEITNIIDWLIKPESQAITGQVIYQGGV